MRRKSILLISILFVFVFQSVTFEKEASAAGNLYDWSFKTGKQVLSAVHIDEDYLYAGGFDSVFYALDLDGKLKWKFNSGFPIKCKATSYDSVVCFQSGNQLFGLHKTKGRLLWVHKPAETSEKNPIIQLDSWDFKDASPIISNDTIFYCNEYGSVFGVNLFTGKEIFKYKTANGKAIRTKPVIKNQIIYFGDHDGYIYAVNLNDASLKWSFRTNNGIKPYPEFGGIFGDMVIDGENLYCGIRNSNFQVININTGKLVWSYESGGTWLSGTPLVNDGFAFIGTSDTHEIISLNNLTRKINWKKAVGFGVYNAPLLIGDQLFVFSGDERYPVSYPGNGSISIFNSSGKLINSIKTNGSVFSTPVYKDGKIYFSSCDCNIYCVTVENLTTSAHSLIKMDESDVDLGLINKIGIETKSLCFVKNEGYKADTLIFTLLINELSPKAITLITKESVLSGKDSIELKAQFSSKYLDNGTSRFSLKVQTKKSGDILFEKKFTIQKEVISGIVNINEKASMIRVFPNPCNDLVTIEYKPVNKANAYLKIFDMNGKIVQRPKSELTSSGNSSFEISTKDIPSQQYVFQIISNNKQIGAGKFLKE